MRICRKPLHDLTPEEDFILGTMLGCNCPVQCRRYLERKDLRTAESIASGGHDSPRNVPCSDGGATGTAGNGVDAGRRGCNQPGRAAWEQILAGLELDRTGLPSRAGPRQ